MTCLSSTPNGQLDLQGIPHRGKQRIFRGKEEDC